VPASGAPTIVRRRGHETQGGFTLGPTFVTAKLVTLDRVPQNADMRRGCLVARRGKTRAWRSVVVLAVAASVVGCTVPTERMGRLGAWLARRSVPAAATPLPHVPTLDPDATELPWAREIDQLVVVSRTCRTLSLYEHGHLARRYPVVFGRNPLGPKRYEGDRRTPWGFYTIVEKRRHKRWARFFLLDYPNVSDAVRYTEAVAAGDVPDDAGRVPGIGGAIGIHGSDKEDLNKQGVDWTHGCVSLTNHDVVELDGLVIVGTPVWIEN
jgi:lipoprotein-anchoring transpeptidase ErfK/SrfK